MGAGDKWVDRDAGPVVRPYALTGGRTEPASGEVLDVIAVVVTARDTSAAADTVGIGPEHRQILSLCQKPVTLADVAAATSLPVGVVRVLLADLIMQAWITVLPGRPADEQPSADLLKEVLHGLRAL